MTASRHDRCALCQHPYADDPNDPSRYIDTCARCDHAEKVFEKRFGIAGDADFIYHELAHFVLRYERQPRRRADWRAMERDLDTQPVGRAQVHELRTLALQGCAYLQLGWKLSWSRLVSLSWGGLDEAASGNGPASYLRGRPVVTSERRARLEVRRYCPLTSPTKVVLLARTIVEFRDDAKTTRPPRRL